MRAFQFLFGKKVNKEGSNELLVGLRNDSSSVSDLFAKRIAKRENNSVTMKEKNMKRAFSRYNPAAYVPQESRPANNYDFLSGSPNREIYRDPILIKFFGTPVAKKLGLPESMINKTFYCTNLKCLTLLAGAVSPHHQNNYRARKLERQNEWGDTEISLLLACDPKSSILLLGLETGSAEYFQFENLDDLDVEFSSADSNWNHDNLVNSNGDDDADEDDEDDDEDEEDDEDDDGFEFDDDGFALDHDEDIRDN